MYYWLVVEPYPSEKWWSESQLGWWHSQDMEKWKNVPNHQPDYVAYVASLSAVSVTYMAANYQCGSTAVTTAIEKWAPKCHPSWSISPMASPSWSTSTRIWFSPPERQVLFCEVWKTQDVQKWRQILTIKSASFLGDPHPSWTTQKLRSIMIPESPQIHLEEFWILLHHWNKVVKSSRFPLPALRSNHHVVTSSRACSDSN